MRCRDARGSLGGRLRGRVRLQRLQRPPPQAAGTITARLTLLHIQFALLFIFFFFVLLCFMISSFLAQFCLFTPQKSPTTLLLRLESPLRSMVYVLSRSS